MDAQDLVVVYTVKNAATAEIIKNALEAEDIPCSLDNESQAGLTGIFDIQVLVRAADEQRARELIETHVHDEMEDIDDGTDVDEDEDEDES